ncbi:MAG: hypothetical protein P1U64_09870 [Alcanivoracaceae bacterium]|nr:hypothetical protein [Alcanivoracaceae bacterium]
MSNQALSEVAAVFAQAEKARESGNIEEALQGYTKVVFFAPKHWPAYFHLGTLFGDKGNHDLAVAMLRRADEIKPDHHVIKNHIADHLMKQELLEEAVPWLEASWSLTPDAYNIGALMKLGKIAWELNDLEKGIAYFDQLLAIEEPADADEGIRDTRHVSRWFRALCFMGLGNFQEAWAGYEWRYYLPGVITPILHGTKWEGQSLEGQRIILAYEQRFGDVIQFIRFVPRLEAMGAKVILQLPPELIRQVRQSFPEVEIVSTEDVLPEYDLWQLATSIPAVLNLPEEELYKDPVPYFDVAGADKRTLPMRPDTQLKVGLVWAGKPEPDRSMPYRHYVPLLRHKEVSFYSFQLGEKRQDIFDAATGWLVRDLGGDITDFYDSSALLQEMDLLITIDTAIAHQAGALGVPVWLMLRWFSDWRWQLGRTDCPWYPGMRLFRQHEPSRWEGACADLYEAFDHWVKQSVQSGK